MTNLVDKKNQDIRRILYPYLWIIFSILSFSALYYFPASKITTILSDEFNSNILIKGLIQILINTFLFASCQALPLILYMQGKMVWRWLLRTWIALVVADTFTLYILGIFLSSVLYPIFLYRVYASSDYYRFLLGVQIGMPGYGFRQLFSILFLSLYYSFGVGLTFGLLQGTFFVDRHSIVRWMKNVMFSVLIASTINSILIHFILKTLNVNLIYPIISGAVYGLFTYRYFNLSEVSQNKS